MECCSATCPPGISPVERSERPPQRPQLVWKCGCLCALAAAVCWSPQAYSCPALPARGVPAAQALRVELAKGLARGLPSISVALVTRQGVIWSEAVGYANLTRRSRAHPGYLYGIGSITKVFVACVVQQLIDEGRL